MLAAPEGICQRRNLEFELGVSLELGRLLFGTLNAPLALLANPEPNRLCSPRIMSGRRQYPFHLIEPKWQQHWDAQQTFRAFNPGETVPETHPFAQRH